MNKTTDTAQTWKSKPPVYTGLREVRTVTVIQTYNCIGSGTDNDPVRAVTQYWTAEGEQITSEPKRFDHFVWLESWVDAYEKECGDGKAREFYRWMNIQPMSN